MNGEYIASSNIFPTVYWKTFIKSDGMMVRHMINHADYWHIYQVIDIQNASKQKTKSAESAYLKIISAHFYDGRSNQMKILNRTLNRLDLFEPFSKWQPLEIQLNDFPDSHPQSNGIYMRIKSENEWRSQMFHLFDNAESIQGLTAFIKRDKINKYCSTLHQLFHCSNNTDAHEWKLQSFEICKLH